VLTPEQTRSIASGLEEPYSSLILFLAVTGLRIGEAVGVQWNDFDGNVLNVQRRIYEGVEDTPVLLLPHRCGCRTSYFAVVIPWFKAKVHRGYPPV
jgi:integrase